MSLVGTPQVRRPALLRDRSGVQRVTIPALGLTACATGVVTVVAAADRVLGMHPPA